MSGRRLELTEDDLLFLETLEDCGFRHVSEVKLKEKLMEKGMSESTYNMIRRKLLFSRYIGAIYGNLTLERSDYKKSPETYSED